MPLYRDEAVVLRAFPLGEADRIVVLLTKQHGKVRAVAKGVRRLKSRFGGRLEPLMRVDVLLAQGKSLDVVSQAVYISAYAGSICADYTSYEYASVMLEVADALVSNEYTDEYMREYQDTSGQYRLLTAALSSLSNRKHAPNAIGISYLLRAMSLAGWSPRLKTCVVCGKEENLCYFSPSAGGVMCAGDHTPESIICSDETRLQLFALLQGDWSSIDGVPIDSSTLSCAKLWAEYYLERPIRSMGLISD